MLLEFSRSCPHFFLSSVFPPLVAVFPVLVFFAESFQENCGERVFGKTLRQGGYQNYKFFPIGFVPKMLSLSFPHLTLVFLDFCAGISLFGGGFGESSVSVSGYFFGHGCDLPLASLCISVVGSRLVTLWGFIFLSPPPPPERCVTNIGREFLGITCVVWSLLSLPPPSFRAGFWFWGSPFWDLAALEAGRPRHRGVPCAALCICLSLSLSLSLPFPCPGWPPVPPPFLSCME